MSKYQSKYITTLCGDLAGGFAVIKVAATTLVYRPVRWKNAQGRTIIPPILDAILHRDKAQDRGIDDINAAGDFVDVDRVTDRIKIDECKRRQSPVGIRNTYRAIGRDWRYPITPKFRA